jgi:hypothetical protein
MKTPINNKRLQFVEVVCDNYESCPNGRPTLRVPKKLGCGGAVSPKHRGRYLNGSSAFCSCGGSIVCCQNCANLFAED